MKTFRLACILLFVIPMTVLSQERFAGPFPSWSNVKTAFGAVGNGIADDTTPLQNALNALGGSSDVMYLPAGTYKITSELTLSHKQNVAIIGEDPATTKVLWAGSAGGIMLHVDGANACRFGRITWDGANTAAIDVWHGWTVITGPSSVDNVHFDEFFVNAQKGLVGGVSPPGSNDDSIRFFRCHFKNNSITGVSVETQNTLNYWIWDSEFSNNARGVANNVGSTLGGNFYVYNSVFTNSSVSDVSVCAGNLPFALKFNTSSGSNQFYSSCNPGQNSEQLIIQGNKILDTTNPVAIQIGDVGTSVLIDNIIRSKPAASGPAIQMGNATGTDFTSIGNKYTVTSPISLGGTSIRTWSVDDSIVTYASINGTIPTLPPTPTRTTTNIVEVAAGASGAAIQTAINNAAVLSNPVVHLPSGTYNVSSTITVPANVNILIAGDSRNVVLNWTSGSAGSIFDMLGPSIAQISDITLSGNHLAEDITLENADQAGAVASVMGSFTQGNTTNDILADNLFNLKTNVIGILLNRSGTLSVLVKGASTSSRVGIFGTTSGTDGSPPAGKMYDVQTGGSLLVTDSWYESGTGPTVFNLTGNGTLTYQSSQLAQVNSGSTSNGIPIGTAGFTGKLSVIDVGMDIPVTASSSNITFSSETAATNVLMMGINNNQAVANYFNRVGPNNGTVTLINNKTFGGSGAFQLADQGNVRTDAFVRTMFAQIRGNQPDLPIAQSAGVTNPLLSRIGFTNATVGLHLKAGAFVGTLFVSKTGSDSNACTSAGSPCLTIGHAYALATAAGDIVQVGAGTYTETLTLGHGGTGGNPIIIRGQDGTGCPTTTVSDVNNPTGVRPASTVTIAGSLTFSASNLTVDCFRILSPGTGSNVSNSIGITNNTITNLEIDGTARTTPGTGIDFDGVDTSAQTGWASNYTIQRNFIHGTSTGLWIACNTCTISENEVMALQGDEPGSDHDYIDAWGNGVIIRHNEMWNNTANACNSYDCHMDCIQTFNTVGNGTEVSKNITFDRNVCFNHHEGVIVQDNAGNGDISNWTVTNNVFAYGPWDDGSGHLAVAGTAHPWCWIVEQGALGTNKFYNNTCISGSEGFRPTSGTADFKDNIWYDLATGNGTPYVFAGGTETGSNNLYFSTGGNTTHAQFAGDIANQNPLFISFGSVGITTPQARCIGCNYSIQSSSPTINSGVSTAPTVTVDLKGVTRPQGTAYDIGAYEFILSNSSGLAINPSSFGYGNQNINTTSASNQFTISNPGTASSTISSIVIGGANASDFAQISSTCGALPATLSVGTNCNINVTFKPLATGARSATITVTDTPDTLTATSSLSGTGLDPTAITIIQAVSCGPKTWPGTCTIAPTAAGDVIAVAYGSYNTAGSAPVMNSITDNAAGGSDVYLAAPNAREINTSGATSWGDVWYSLNVKAGATILTLTPSTTQTGDAFVWEISNVSAIDTSGNLSSQATTLTPVTPTMNTSSLRGAIVGFLHPNGSSVPSGIHTGNLFTSDSLNDNMGFAHLITNNNGAYTAQWDMTPTGTYGSSAVAFMPATAPSIGATIMVGLAGSSGKAVIQ